MSHALLSASGAKRWLACPPSARLETSIIDTGSPYAMEGTVAHELAETTLSYRLNKISKDEHLRNLSGLGKTEYYNTEMVEYVMQYVDYVLGAYHTINTKSNDVEFIIEARVDYSNWAQEGFGTADAVIITDGVMEICDLKYGKGVKVDAFDNPQLKLYALGAYSEYKELYDFDKVRMTIVQPRLDHIDSFEISIRELLTWAVNTVRPIARLAYEGKGEFKSGEHCRWCKIKATCRVRADKNLELARYEFRGSAELSEDEIAEILIRANELAKWASDVWEHAYKEALGGKKWAGFKLVEGRSNRKYADIEAIEHILHANGFDEDQIYDKNLKGITGLSKSIGVKNFNKLLEGYIIKPSGKPTLVVESDKRPEMNVGCNEFDTYE